MTKFTMRPHVRIAHMAQARRGVQSVRKALTLLKLFSSKPVLQFREIVRLSRMHRSSVYRLVKTLQETGFLQEDGHNAFRLGPVLSDLRPSVELEVVVRDLAGPVMRHLVTNTLETVHLSVFDGDRVLFLDAVDSPRAIRHHISIGKRVPPHAGASGKLLLAYQPPEYIDAILGAPLTRLTARTVVDPGRLRRHLEKIRRTGYSITHGESEPGATGLAVPIRDRAGIVRAGLTLSMPSSRWRRQRQDSMLAALRQAAEEISRGLGWEVGPNQQTNQVHV